MNSKFLGQSTQKKLTPNQVRQKAIKFLARREYSQFQLIQKLNQIADPGLVKPIVDQLTADNWQSDLRYVNIRVNYLKKKYGRIKIINELKKSGINPELINQSIDQNLEYTDQAEIQRAQEIIRKKYKLPLSSINKQNIQSEKIKRIRFMHGRGFTLSIIYQALAIHDF